MSVLRFTIRLAMPMALPTALAAQPYSFDDAQQFLKSDCRACHQGFAPPSGFPSGAAFSRPGKQNSRLKRLP